MVLAAHVPSACRDRSVTVARPLREETCARRGLGGSPVEVPVDTHATNPPGRDSDDGLGPRPVRRRVLGRLLALPLVQKLRQAIPRHVPCSAGAMARRTTLPAQPLRT